MVAPSDGGFGGVLDEDDLDLAPDNVIPFPNMRANPKLAELWARERTAANKRADRSYRFDDPLSVLDDQMRRRQLPQLPWPAQWTEIARRCRLHVGECVGICGPSGGGKTSFAIQIGLAATAAGIPVLWIPLELTQAEINTRIVANMNGTHTSVISDEWTRERIAHSLTSVTDLWRYVDTFLEPMETIAAAKVAIGLAKRVYGMPPLVVWDYVGKLSALDDDDRKATRKYAEIIRRMTVEEECFTLLLSQPSRENNKVLTGKVELESATDAIGVSGGSSEIEHACAVIMGLNVFKVDDRQELDGHILISKARNTGLEGRQGARFAKPGGVWHELASLPPTPAEVKRQLAIASKDKSRITPATESQVAAELAESAAGDAAAQRRGRILDAIRRMGGMGMTNAELRNVPGSGRAQVLKDALAELLRAGCIEQIGSRYRAVARIE